MPVHYVDVKNLGAGCFDVANLLTEIGEIRCEQ